MQIQTPSCIIADDEPLLAAALKIELQKLWPELVVLKTVNNGQAALVAINELKPTIAFLDIRMPGLSGIEVAQALAEGDTLGDDGNESAADTFVVFVTAYDEYATQAFDAAAVDYVLKPLTAERLSKCIARLKKHLSAAAPAAEVLLTQLQQLMGATKSVASHANWLRHIRASVGDTVKLIPIDEVAYFQAADKYVIVMTAQGESLVREALKELITQLNPERFIQIHRGTVVNIDFVQEMQKDELGKHVLVLKGLKQRPIISRLYAHLFKAM